MKNEKGGIRPFGVVREPKKGIGPGSAGQSGDTQGLPDVAEADSESVEELIEEGQASEAELVLEMEETPEGEAKERTKEVTTKQVPQDDVPLEYLNQD
jgi:hypothetical protein